MHIVIYIPNWIYNAIMGHRNPVYPQYLADAVRDGKPLPKGHGRLIDADVLKTAFPCGESVRTECVRSTINYAQTIIEADIESEVNADADSC